MDLYCAAKDRASSWSWIVVNRELDVFIGESGYEYEERYKNSKLHLGTGWEPIAYEGLVQWE